MTTEAKRGAWGGGFGADLEIPDAVPILPSKTKAAGVKKQEQVVAAPEAPAGGDVPGSVDGVSGFGVDANGGGDRGGNAEEEA